MADKIPLRAVFDANDNATGISEFQANDSIAIAYGGTGLSQLGAVGQILKVNNEGTGLEYVNNTTDQYLEKANAEITFVTKTTALSSNTTLNVLINDRIQVSNAQVQFLRSANTSVTANANSITVEQNTVDLEDRVLINPAGFITLNIGGVNYKLPFFS